MKNGKCWKKKVRSAKLQMGEKGLQQLGGDWATFILTVRRELQITSTPVC